MRWSILDIAVLVVLVFVQLVGVIGRIADDDADLPRVLALNARNILVAQRSEQITLLAL